MSGDANNIVNKRVIVGISGASGFSYGVQVLHYLRQLNVESHVVISPAAHLNREHETSLSEEDVTGLADVVYPFRAVGAAIASGSFRTDGMIVAPCSMHTLAAIANGLTDNLLTRAADVVLKERRRLVLMARETPLHAGHLRNMQWVTEMGGIVFPPVPALYARPQSVAEIVAHSAARALGLLDLDCAALPRWGESIESVNGSII
ncbi:UbiX family flavin prenyltransferase [Erwinia endophytica]|uniref:UbiX family flavin prenyltransferase n=1 Tax=Erwinia endophytica TaxID=1563158 RepID=UPI001265E8B9|nr:UbiX family flavin prenyltransferase [Erwinia endophytica]KAB8312556.1 UbiX family flavin prenyltransferase [Erwinia endophytica]